MYKKGPISISPSRSGWPVVSGREPTFPARTGVQHEMSRSDLANVTFALTLLHDHELCAGACPLQWRSCLFLCHVYSAMVLTFAASVSQHYLVFLRLCMHESSIHRMFVSDCELCAGACPLQ